MVTLFIVWLHFIGYHQSLERHLKIDPVRIVGMRVRVCVFVYVCVCVCLCVCVCVCVCVCPRPRLLITSGVIWCDMNLIRLVKQVLQLLYGNYSRYR